MGKEVFSLLKFSYDSLPDDTVRSCLLYCSLFSEDATIPKEMLIDFWIGEGFIDERNNTSQARNQGHHVIGSLIRACLLEAVEDWGIKMHDVIRDMSLWIACKCEAEKWKFFVEAGYHLTEMPEVGKWRGIRRMSLMQNEIENLTEAPNCPDLQTLFLNDNWRLKVIHNDFFQFMCGLKVLSLEGNSGITELPVGISKLVSLQYLDLSSTGIKQLPMELKALENLKCLILECFNEGIKIPRGLISGFPKLQTLRMIGSISSKDKSNEWLVEELQCLKHLNALTVTITSALAVDRLLNAEMLHSCIQQIGLQSFRDSEQLNFLSLANMKNLRHMSLYDCQSLEAPIQSQISVISTKRRFQNLNSVSISSCSKLMDLTWLVVLAPNLSSVSIIACKKMEEIISELRLSQVAELVGTLSPFAKLKSLNLWDLPELKSIYWEALPFPCLEEIDVERCPKLRRLPLNSNNAKESKIRIKGEEKWWKEVEWEDEDTRNAFLPCFVAV